MDWRVIKINESYYTHIHINAHAYLYTILMIMHTHAYTLTSMYLVELPVAAEYTNYFCAEG